MTLPEHALLSVMISEFTVRKRWGWRGVVAVVTAGVAPDIDTATKLLGDVQYWRLHHAIGHNVFSLIALSATIAWLARTAWSIQPSTYLFGWCFLAAAAHTFTDALYWWGIKILRPLADCELLLNWIEYLDLVVLATWLSGGCLLYRFPARGRTIAAGTIGFFALYLAIRAISPVPVPGSIVHFITGGWMYVPDRDTPVLDWW